MNSIAPVEGSVTDDTATSSSNDATLDDLDLNEPLGERKGAACSMEEGCESCQ